ncbi:hypothetical protein [Spirosoma montaniterrae]|uniref:Uncharacterized protein n=1 Tax=Spirosoma montaniterrae TaxID=1178516 RepID=A0A1P9X3C9_9BACT|nr:hypothetical protein [Spirosoma montaniterrae]AQG82130.1 hypothetical protein AWR27_24230 [Spirosoma montaniterrae]
MKNKFNFRLRRDCSLPTQTLDQLSIEALKRRKTAAEEMLLVVSLLALSVIVMAVWSGLYPLVLCTFGMQPAFSDYLTKRKAIINQLNRRSA